MISVLCDQPFFDGNFAHLQEARQKSKLPLLCKEFIIDEVQLDAARSYGASAALLIVRCLEDEQLSRLISASFERGLTPLVEVYTEEEAQRALDAGARFIGVNARDLDTLEMDSARARRIVQSFPEPITVAHLSGIKSAEDTRGVAHSRADVALIGEVLMRLDDPSEQLAQLRRACN
jgi:indole-3-glycerol phosphate synthase